MTRDRQTITLGRDELARLIDGAPVIDGPVLLRLDQGLKPLAIAQAVLGAIFTRITRAARRTDAVAETALAMRRAQRRYFALSRKDRGSEQAAKALDEAKRLERELDRLLGIQPSNPRSTR